MTLLQFMDNHPVWTFFYLCVICSTVGGSVRFVLRARHR